ncbi:MAG TPA: hypothetical protein VGO06_13745 [Bosea sp. (in: a-proteobacteria)]|jgi:hypothetical protein|uniref:hypothetical protein n=1 Tax=Bosea sp. (in: a-proteobacteria) TaxID=1871050 RepID=UPI002E131783|nr:hypothetical protein [Bosea sp. (in: a-proteobacteria)]
MSNQDTKARREGFGRALLCDAAAVSGVGLISFGAWQVYAPAGPIVLGLLLVAGALIGARNL